MKFRLSVWEKVATVGFLTSIQPSFLVGRTANAKDGFFGVVCEFGSHSDSFLGELGESIHGKQS